LTIEELPKFKKILIIRLSSLGDILLTTPFIRSIKNQFPNLEIDFVIRAQYSDVLKLNPYVNKVFTFSRIENDNFGIIKEIKNSEYDLVIDLQNNLRSNKLVSMLKTQSVSFSKNSLNKFLLVNFKINKLKYAPQIPVRYSQTISDFKLDEKGLDLFTDKTPSVKLVQKGNIIGFCPGARHFTKRWPKEYFIELGKKLTAYGYSIVLFGGKIDIEICAAVANEIPGAINLSNNDDILQTAADMELCKAIICNDSGLMHAASAVGTKVVTIFGSSVKEFGFTPYICTNLILENKLLNCRPCSHIGRSKCPKKHFDCMQLIKPQFVFEKVISFITDK
jgi:lipopolysaccharide heptosyltransferase II